jgi:hypothetical protein
LLGFSADFVGCLVLLGFLATVVYREFLGFRV